MEPIAINAAVATKIFLRPIISANDPAISCPRIEPTKAAEATEPSRICKRPVSVAYSGYSSRRRRKTRLMTKRSYYNNEKKEGPGRRE